MLTANDLDELRPDNQKPKNEPATPIPQRRARRSPLSSWGGGMPTYLLYNSLVRHWMGSFHPSARRRT
ncbi:hypothetical protein GCM10011348_30230 [Marinobacterium nitratireducens]|uniref:Uncharacterized protein n=1 Tax=Marinobacterium nitratireducens TaxID=518897 RepID=A0A918DW68_9GAMM|nr:hypothetical protein [Marinobacterium nitratireducens]GGO84300.1 hypothetical protein GCM10011348_30230 [Marinobacterium nitratireducens]